MDDDTAREEGIVGNEDVEGARSESADDVDAVEVLRVFGTGKDGSGPVGGLSEGRDGLGRVVAMMA